MQTVDEKTSNVHGAGFLTVPLILMTPLFAYYNLNAAFAHACANFQLEETMIRPLK